MSILNLRREKLDDIRKKLIYPRMKKTLLLSQLTDIYSEKLETNFDYNKRLEKKILPIQTASQFLMGVIT